MLDDYLLLKQNNTSEVQKRNLDHYHEWLTIALPAHTGLPPPSPEKLAEKIHDFSAREVEIHFHTFTRTSALDFLQLVRRQILPDSYVLEAVDARAEILLVLKKGEAAH